MNYDFSYWIFMIPGLLLTTLASWYVQSSYRKWSQVRSRSGLTGAQAAQRLLSNVSYQPAEGANLRNVRIMSIGGTLSDHYDPRDKTLRLSEGVANSPSVAAVAIAAHELGHAVQDAEGYGPMRLRAALVPVVTIGSNLGWILIIAGLILQWVDLAWLGVLVFSGGALFALATLPVELNASNRAREMLSQSGIIQGEQEAGGVNTVLTAAALTYIAGLATAILQLLYYVFLVGGLNRRRD